MKLSDVKEFARVMVLSILVMVRRIREMVRDFLEGVRIFAQRIVRAVREAVMTLVRNLEQLVRAVGREIREVGRSIAGGLRVIYGILLTFARRIGSFLREQGARIMSVLHRFRMALRYFYYTAILPPIHRIRGWFRHVYLMAKLAWGRFSEAVRAILSRTRQAFLKVWRQFISAIHRAVTRASQAMLAVLTRIHRFFQQIAHAFMRMVKWTIRSIQAFWARVIRAFARCDPRFFIIFFMAVGGYWYFVINTNHRITALVLSFLLSIVIEAILFPIIASGIASLLVWINRYHPILALVKRSGIAFHRVWFTTLFISTAFARSMARTITLSFHRIILSLSSLMVLTAHGIVRVLTPPILYTLSLLRAIHERIIMAISALMWSGYLILRFIALGVAATASLILAIVMTIARITWSALIWTMARIRSGVIIIYRTMAHIMSILATAMLSALRAIAHAGLMAARAIGHAMKIVGGWIMLAIAVFGTAMLRVANAVHRGLVKIYRGILWTMERIFNAVLAIYWTVTRTLIAVYRAIASAVIRAVVLVTTAIITIVSMVFLAFVRISTLMYRMVMTPMIRTTIAFRRTMLTIAVGAALVFTLVATGVYEAVIKVTLPVFMFLIRNLMAWHRVLFTVYFFAVKVGTAIVASILALWDIIVTSLMAFMKWSLLMLRTHYRGIRDISLIFSPSIATGILYLVIGGTLFLVIAVLWTIGITSLSYLYNRKKGAELNV